MAKNKSRKIKSFSDLSSWNFIIFLTLAFMLIVSVAIVLSRSSYDIRSRAWTNRYGETVNSRTYTLRNRNGAPLQPTTPSVYLSPTVSPVPVPSRIPGSVLFEDNFDTDKGWIEAAAYQGASKMINNSKSYLNIVENPNNYRKFRVLAPLLESDIPTEYSIEVEANNTPNSDPDSSYGIIFNALSNNNSLYAYLISPSRRTYQVMKFSRIWITIASGFNANINEGETVNALKLERIGSEIRVYANSELLWSGYDNSYRGGQVGITVWKNDTRSSAEAAFDNFILRVIQ